MAQGDWKNLDKFKLDPDKETEASSESSEFIGDIKETAEAEESNYDICALAKQIKSRRQKDFDLVVCVSSQDEGGGKSTFANEIVMLNNGLKLDQIMDWEGCQDKIKRQLDQFVVYDSNYRSVEKSLLTLPENSAFNVDEAMKAMYKRQFQNRQQIYLNTVFTCARKRHMVTLLCIPSLFDLDPYFRKRRVLLWAQVLWRNIDTRTGKVLLSIRDWSPYAPDPWWMKENQNLIEQLCPTKRVLDFDPDIKLDVLRKTRNYFADFDFSALPEPAHEYYKELNKQRLTYNDSDDPATRAKMYRDSLTEAVALLYKSEKLNHQDIADNLGLSTSLVQKLLREAKSRKMDQE